MSDRITINEEENDIVIVAIGYSDPKRAIQAHGYDPDDVDYTVE